MASSSAKERSGVSFEAWSSSFFACSRLRSHVIARSATRSVRTKSSARLGGAAGTKRGAAPSSPST
jgi:hypothetical protein